MHHPPWQEGPGSSPQLFEQFRVGRSEPASAPGHDDGRGGLGPVHGIIRTLALPAPLEIAYELGRHGPAEDIAGKADRGSRVEHGPDGGFGMVAHHQSHELASGGHWTTAQIHPDLSVVVFQVTAGGQGTQVDPGSQNSMPDKTRVLLVGEIPKGALPNFARDPVPDAEGRMPVQPRARFDQGSRSNI